MSTAITKKVFKKLLREVLREEPGIIKEILPTYPAEIATKEDIKLLIQMMDAKFEAVDKRFEALHREMDARFEALYREMGTRFEAVDKRLNIIIWVLGIGFTLMGGGIITLIIQLLVKG